MTKVRLSDRALASLRSHRAWLLKRNPAAAGGLGAEVNRAMRLLADNPEMGPRVEGTGSRCKVTRHYRYKLIYVVQGDEVLITDILHPRQSGPGPA